MTSLFLPTVCIVWCLAAGGVAADDDDDKPRCPAPPPCKCIWDTRNNTTGEGEQNTVTCADLDLQQKALNDFYPSDLSFVKANFSRNHLYDISIPGYFESLINLTTIDLSHNILVTVPLAVRDLPNVTHLYLQDNRITLEDPDLFSTLTGLEFLDLGKNRIHNLTNGAFTGLRSLKYLVLKKNDLKNIEPESFADLPSLKYLYLKDNKITNLAPDTFKGLTSLKKLDLEENDVATLEEGAFNDLENLESIDMTDNEIRGLTKAALKGLKNIKTLRFRFCWIRKLEHGIFDDLRNMSTLNLGLNELDTMSQGIFGKAEESISYISYAYNYIHKFSRNFFRPFKSLKYLILDANPLDQLPDVTSVESLTYISIRETRIHMIYACELLTISAGLNWGSSPIRCDCSSLWLKLHHDRQMEWRQLLKPDAVVTQSSTWRCASPPHLHGKSFAEVDASEFTCPAGENPHYCRPGDLHEYKAVRVPITVAKQSRNSFHLSWSLFASAAQMKEIDNVTVIANAIDEADKISVNTSLANGTTETTVGGLDYGVTYNICVAYWHVGRATKINYVIGRNCTEEVIPGYVRAYMVVVPLVVILVAVGIAAVIIYLRFRPSGKSRTGTNMGGIENMTYDVTNARVSTSLPAALNFPEEDKSKA